MENGDHDDDEICIDEKRNESGRWKWNYHGN